MAKRARASKRVYEQQIVYRVFRGAISLHYSMSIFPREKKLETVVPTRASLIFANDLRVKYFDTRVSQINNLSKMNILGID